MADLTNADLTTITPDADSIDEGTGLFDILMRSISIRLEQEKKAGRIQSADFAKVYLGAMESAMSQSIAYLIQKQTANEQAELIIAQTANEVLQGALITANTAKVNSEKALIDKQYDVAVVAEANALKEGLKLDAETALINAQEFKLENIDTPLVVAETAKTNADTSLITQNAANALSAASNIPKAGAKLDAETSLLDQKRYTEEAQTKDTANGIAVVGLVGKQKDLYTAQEEGFARDAEQKAAKIAVDAWSVRSSVDPDTMTEPSGIADSDITAIMAKVKTGIGA